jgi:uncharacterized protein YwqG
LIEQEQLRQLIHDAGLSDRENDILSFVKPAIRLHTARADESTLPIGASKIGGLPDLPPDIAWPEWYGHALDFIAQINFADVIDDTGQLPAKGLLYLFYNLFPDWVSTFTDEAYKVVYSDARLDGLQRTIAPTQEISTYPTCKVTFHKITTLPEYESYEVGKILGMSYYSMKQDDSDKYWNLLKSLPRADERLPKQQLLGYPDLQQGDVFLEAEMIGGHLKSAEVSYEIQGDMIRNWMLLLQIDTDDQTKMMWGDVGMLYCCLRKDALQAQRFDDTVVIMQCG